MVLTGRHARTLLRGRAFLWSALAFGALLTIAVLASPPSDGVFVAALLPAALVVVVWSASVGATGADALPADRTHGRTTWLRTLGPPGWKDRIGAALAAMGGVLTVGVAAAVGLGVWAVIDLDEFVLRTHSSIDVAPRERMAATRVDGEPGPPWMLALPPAGAEHLVRRVQLGVRPYGDVRRTRARVAFHAAGKSGQLDVATRGSFTIVVPAAARELTMQSLTSRVGLRIRRAAILGEDRAPAWPIAVRVLWMALIVAAIVPLGIACSRFTSSATAGGLVMCLLLFGMVRRPLLELVEVLRVSDEPTAAISLLQALGYVVPDMPLLSLASDTADGRLVSFASIAPWGGILAFAVAGLLLVWLPVRRERLS